MRQFIYSFLFLSVIASSLLLEQSCSKQGQAQNIPAITSTVFSGIANYHSYYYNPKDTMIKMDSQLVYITPYTTSFNPSVYITSVKTDKSGNFSFYDLNPTLQYIIFTHGPIASSSSFAAPYLGTVDTKLPYDTGTTYTVSAYLDSTKTNGISISTQDIYGGRISGALVILYSSRVIAMADTVFSGAGALLKFTTDSLGKAVATGLPAGTIFVNALLQIDSNTRVREIGNSTNVNSKGFQLMTLTLQ
jgi:hypothetical protein